mmetsp:Transcript_33413/g.50546  ORF Transcript_33413/g.50546 Transcript_33413/m.50546 type:complete len:205 (-) Transcript_33413:30-644(-)
MISLEHPTGMVSTSNYHGEAVISWRYTRLSVVVKPPTRDIPIMFSDTTSMVFSHGHCCEDFLARYGSPFFGVAPAQHLVVRGSDSTCLRRSCRNRVKELAGWWVAHAESLGTPASDRSIGAQPAIVPISRLELDKDLAFWNLCNVVQCCTPAGNSPILSQSTSVLRPSRDALVPLTGGTIGNLARDIPAPAHSCSLGLRQAAGV